MTLDFATTWIAIIAIVVITSLAVAGCGTSSRNLADDICKFQGGIKMYSENDRGFSVTCVEDIK